MNIQCNMQLENNLQQITQIGNKYLAYHAIWKLIYN